MIFSSVLYPQDFEALTPNLLARTIETVEGGGLVILALHSLSSLTSLYTMVMVRYFSTYALESLGYAYYRLWNLFPLHSGYFFVLMCLYVTLFSTQDVHERFRTESHSLAAGRFNERFLLSLASCKSCVVVDDELHILPISSHIRSITPVSVLEASLIIIR